MQSKFLKNLEDRTTELTYRYEQLRKSNMRLQNNHLSLLEEKERLLKHNNLARNKIRNMIDRLKNMEQDDDDKS